MREAIVEATRAEIMHVLEECIQVTLVMKTEGNWKWAVGLECNGLRGDFNGFWDDSTLSEEHAQGIAAECREILAERLMRAIADAHIR